MSYGNVLFRGSPGAGWTIQLNWGVGVQQPFFWGGERFESVFEAFSECPSAVGSVPSVELVYEIF